MTKSQKIARWLGDEKGWSEFFLRQIDGRVEIWGAVPGRAPMCHYRAYRAEEVAFLATLDDDPVATTLKPAVTEDWPLDDLPDEVDIDGWIVKLNRSCRCIEDAYGNRLRGIPAHRMTPEEYRAWVEGRSGGRAGD